jgi:Symplekin tight junction protein C terminal
MLTGPEATLSRSRDSLRALTANVELLERVEIVDGARVALLDARRARVHPDILRPFLVDLCVVAIGDAVPTVRAIAPAAIEDMCLRDLRTFIVDGTPFLYNALDDANSLVVSRAVRTITALFRRVMGLATVCGVGPVPGRPSDVDPLPEECFRAWLSIRNHVVALVHHVHDGISKAAVKFAETAVLALSYSGTNSIGSQEHFTLDFARSRNSLSATIDLEELELFGRRTVDEIVCIILKPITDIHDVPLTPVRPHPYITALSVLGNLARRRKLLLELTLPPLLAASSILVEVENGHQCMSNLSKGQRASAVMILRLSLQALRSYSHVRSPHIAKGIVDTCTALSTFEAREYGANLLPKSENTQAVFPAQTYSAQETSSRDIRLLASVAESPARIPAKRLHSHAVADCNALTDLPPARLAASAARLYGQVMPPPQLIDFIIVHLLKGPTMGSDPQGRDYRRANKRGRGLVRDNDRESVGTKVNDGAGTMTRRPQPRRLYAPAVVVPRMDSNDRVRLLQIQCRRILGSESKLAVSGASSLRVLILARLLTMATQSGGENAAAFVHEIVDFIVEDLAARIELALAWLHSSAAAFFLPCGFAVSKFELESFSHGDHCVKSSPPSSVHLLKDDSTPRNGAVEDVAIPDSIVGILDSHKAALESDASIPGAIVEGVCSSAMKLEPYAVNQTELATVENIGPGICTIGRENGTSVRENENSILNEVSSKNTAHLDSNYEMLLSALLKCASMKREPEDRLISRLIVEAPVVTDGAITIVLAHARDAARSRLGLSTLRDIVIERPGSDRDRCLEILLGFTIDDDEVLRGPAIRLVASKLFEDLYGDIPDAVEAFALKAVKDALEPCSGLPSATFELEYEQSVLKILEKNLWLLTALCVKKNDLLIHVVNFYTGASAPVKNILTARGKDIAGQIGPTSTALLDLIRSDEDVYSNNIEELGDFVLLLTAASVGRTGGHIPPELVEAVRVRYDKTKDARFIREVVSGLTRNEIALYLNVLVSIGGLGSSNDGSNEVESVHGNGFKTAVREIMTVRPRPITPTDLIVELHNLSINAELCSALKSCFELKVIFKEGDIARALQKLAHSDRVPELLMRTVLLAHVYYPSLDQFVRETVMLGLIRRQIWKNELLWKGFVQYCSETVEASLGLLASLPLPELSDILCMHIDLRSAVSRVLKCKDIRLRKTVRSHFAAAIRNPVK